MIYSKIKLVEKSGFHVAGYDDGWAIYNRYNKRVSPKFPSEDAAWEQLETEWLKNRSGTDFKLGE